jgi:hypothetical protein
MLRRLTAASALPLTTAIQGLALTLVALFSYSVAPRDAARVATGELPKPGPAISGDLQIPRDLAREQLPLPKFPKLDAPGEDAAPTPSPEVPKAPIAEGEKLAALRVSSVALAGLVTMDSPTPIPDAPDVIGLHDMGGSSGRSWLGGSERTSRGGGNFMGPSDVGDEGSGWGGSGWGGIGRGRGGHGDNCVPGRGGLIRRPPRSPGGTTASPSGGGSGGGGGQGQPSRGDRPSRGGSKL